MATQRINLVEELYIPFLSTIQIYADENGELYRSNNGNNKPCELSGKRLLLPTEQNLQRANDAEHIFFHPLSENIARGDSAVYNWLKLAGRLIPLVFSAQIHAKLYLHRSDRG